MKKKMLQRRFAISIMLDYIKVDYRSSTFFVAKNIGLAPVSILLRQLVRTHSNSRFFSLSKDKLSRLARENRVAIKIILR